MSPIPFMKRFISLVALIFIGSIILPGCESGSSLSVEDFNFDGPHGSDGARIEKMGENHFKVALAHAPNHPEWPNKLNFEITQNAKGNDLRLEVEFDGGPGMSFNEYFQSWSYGRQQWQPIHWEKGKQESPQHDILTFPTFEEDQVFVGTQVPMSFKEAEKLLKEWAEYPDASLKTIGESIQGRPLYRLEINDAQSPVSPEDRWVHYFANQHPGEHNSQWRMAGMVDWILSEEGADYRQKNISHFIFYMSPDASTHGWYRVNGEGVDMNRSYRAEGTHPEEQTHEAYQWQRDLEELMDSNTPVTSIWAMHTWQGIVEPLLREGPEMGSVLGPWTDFRDIMEENDPDNLIKPLAVREGMPGYGATSWSDGPHKQFGATSILCEGAGSLYTKEANIRSGEIIIESIAAYYDKREKQGN